MSTSPDRIPSARAEDRIVTLLSQWLARHVSDDALRAELEGVGRAELAPGQAEAVEELSDELGKGAQGRRGELEMVVRETLEALALGE